jgi:hypothetical protein
MTVRSLEASRLIGQKDGPISGRTCSMKYRCHVPISIRQPFSRETPFEESVEIITQLRCAECVCFAMEGPRVVSRAVHVVGPQSLDPSLEGRLLAACGAVAAYQTALVRVCDRNARARPSARTLVDEAFPSPSNEDRPEAGSATPADRVD